MIRFISFEGGDGSGKTTQLKLLEGYLVARGKDCLATREPGGTTLGRMIRQVLLERGGEAISSPTELFLYLADRSHHVHTVIQPALQQGKMVLCDRFTDSTLAYQGYGRGIDLNRLRRLNQFTGRGITPDLTLLLDCPVKVGLSRTAQRVGGGESGKKREDRFEREQVEFHERVRKGFLELARLEPRRIVVLDASRSARKVHQEIRGIVERAEE
ncbi:MAG: dTMP kinase [Candidatus Binatia bacterium]